MQRDKNTYKIQKKQKPIEKSKISKHEKIMKIMKTETKFRKPKTQKIL